MRREGTGALVSYVRGKHWPEPYTDYRGQAISIHSMLK